MINVFYIYVYFDPSRDLEAIYVGKGKGKRSHAHLTRTDKHPFTQRLQKMAKLGVIPIIERYEGLTEEAAFALEIALIAEIGRKDLSKGTLLNLSDGGEGPNGCVFSAEAREKIASKQRGRPLPQEHRDNIAKGTKGRVVSIETKRKMSEAALKNRESTSKRQKGKPMSEAAKQAMRDGWAKRRALKMAA